MRNTYLGLFLQFKHHVANYCIIQMYNINGVFIHIIGTGILEGQIQIKGLTIEEMSEACRGSGGYSPPEAIGCFIFVTPKSQDFKHN